MTRNAKKVSFTAVLENPQKKVDAAFVTVPIDTQPLFGTRGHIKIKATFDGHPYRGIIANMGTGHHLLLVRKDIRASIGKKVGDKVYVEIEQDFANRVVEMPEDLTKAFAKNKKAQLFFETLSYTNQKEYAFWIASAKKTITREMRVQEAINMLLKGLKNPSQK
jgi:hypothetical protein